MIPDSDREGVSSGRLPRAVRPPRVLLPNVPEPQKWAVIACDQFTSQPEYWEQLRAFIAEAPSTLDLILPEVYLAERLDTAPGEIAAAFEHYTQEGLFDEVSGFILVERTTSDGEVRLGVMADIALAEYEFSEPNQARIKATEESVPMRLPPRVAIREAASFESPHIMLLFNDPDRRLLEGLYHRRDGFRKLYDFELNQGGGHLRGWLVPVDISEELLALENDGVLFVVGDGNHSLAAAKLAGDPYALVELANLHGETLVFEPIHRVVHGADVELINHLRTTLRGPSELRLRHGDCDYVAQVPQNPADAISEIQEALDDYAASHPEVEIDYVHGDQHLESVARRPNTVAIFMPTLDKNGLFDYVSRRGVLPRKSFSMGHAEDKRYYFELAMRNRPGQDSDDGKDENND